MLLIISDHLKASLSLQSSLPFLPLSSSPPPPPSHIVLCTIGNCTSCSDDDVCVECAHGLVTNGTICEPRRGSRSALGVGAIFGECLVSLYVPKKL